MVERETPGVAERRADLAEEAARPAQFAGVGAGGDEAELLAVAGSPCGVAAVFDGVVFGREVAAAAPVLIADAPVGDVERRGFPIGGALRGERGGAGGGVAVLDPMPEFLRRQTAQVSGE